MGSRDPRIDAYIANAAPFAQPIIRQVRTVVHATCRDAEETLKWGVPTFMYHGILCGIAAFKGHCMLGFWKGSLITDRKGKRATDDVGRMGRLTSVSDLPAKTVLAHYVRQAMTFNEKGVKAPWMERRAKPKPAPRVPADLKAALGRDRKAAATFAGFSPSHRREYIEWITEAKGEDTRKRRIATTLEWLRQGKPRNWKYM